jgi:methylase of polypeptide subunit release factors
MQLNLPHLGIVLEVPAGVDAPRLDVANALTFPMPFEPGKLVLDLGCGAGLYTVLALKAGAHVMATDVDARATDITKLNVVSNGLSTENLRFGLGDLFEAVPKSFQCDLIVANLPQTPCPDTLEMTPSFRASKWAGADGLAYIRGLFQSFDRILRPDGSLMMLQIGWLDWKSMDDTLERQGYRCTVLGYGRRHFTWEEYDSYAPGLSAALQEAVRQGTAQPIESSTSKTFAVRWVQYRRA